MEKLTQQFTVKAEDTAIALGSGSLEVLATPHDSLDGKHRHEPLCQTYSRHHCRHHRRHYDQRQPHQGIESRRSHHRRSLNRSHRRSQNKSHNPRYRRQRQRNRHRHTRALHRQRRTLHVETLKVRQAILQDKLHTNIQNPHIYNFLHFFLQNITTI